MMDINPRRDYEAGRLDSITPEGLPPDHRLEQEAEMERQQEAVAARLQHDSRAAQPRPGLLDRLLSWIRRGP